MGQILVNFDEALYADVRLSAEQILWWEQQRREWLAVMRPFSPTAFDATDHGEVFQKASPIPADLLANARLVWGRERILDEVPQGSIAAEVGVLKGFFTQEILRRTNPRELHLFDLDFRPLDACPEFQHHGDSRLLRHLGDSSTELAKLPDGYFDYIYIDGNHTRPSVARDLDTAARKLKPGGLVQLNDYTPFCYMHLQPYGVMHAVNDFVARYHWNVAYFALHPLGYHDIALRKP